MNKNVEKEFFNHVYGGRFQIEEIVAEVPDFLIANPKGITLGVEITEIYSDVTDARLKNHKGYLADLLDGKRGAFRADKGKMDVDDIKIIKGDGSGEQEIRAVIRKVLPFDESISLINKAIKDKNEKVQNYLKCCDSVDLIISDTLDVFLFEKFEDFHRPFFYKVDRNLINGSSFREIYLIFSLLKNNRVYAPLRINAFLRDLYAIESFVSEEEMFEQWENERGFEVIFASLYNLNHKDFSVEIGSDRVAIHFGAWCFEYKENGKNLKDHSNDLFLREKGVKIENIIANISAQQSNIAKRLAEKRWDVIACLPIHFPIQSHNNQIQPIAIASAD